MSMQHLHQDKDSAQKVIFIVSNGNFGWNVILRVDVGIKDKFLVPVVMVVMDLMVLAVEKMVKLEPVDWV